MISQKLREEILWSGPCAYCGDPVPTQVDHILPRSRGGTDDRANLAPACKGCNMEKLDFTPEEYREYRESEGLGWPPESRWQKLDRIIKEATALYGLTADDKRRILARLAEHSIAERNATAEAQLTELERLTVERAEIEARIADYRGGALRPLLRRLDKVQAELDALA
jgi:HNH endonuclease